MGESNKSVRKTQRQDMLDSIAYRCVIPVPSVDTDSSMSSVEVLITHEAQCRRLVEIGSRNAIKESSRRLVPEGYSRIFRYDDRLFVKDYVGMSRSGMFSYDEGLGVVESNKLYKQIAFKYRTFVMPKLLELFKYYRHDAKVKDVLDYGFFDNLGCGDKLRWAVSNFDDIRILNGRKAMAFKYRGHGISSYGMSLFLMSVGDYRGFDFVWRNDKTGEVLPESEHYYTAEELASNVEDGGVSSKVMFKPYAKQQYFLSSNLDEILYGGARGGGKTYALIHDAALHVRRWHYDDKNNIVIDSQSIDYPDYTCLLLRRKYSDLVVNFKPVSDYVYKQLGGVWRDKERHYLFPSGARIYLAYCDEYRDVEKYIGGNFTYLGIEEVNQFPEQWVQDIGTSVRSSNPELKPFKRYTTNPGGIGHMWLKRRFVDPMPPVIGDMKHSVQHNISYNQLNPAPSVLDDDGNSRWYIPATVFDNDALVKNDKKYVSMLKSLTGVKRKMWLNGEWDEMSGVFFNEWNPSYHVMSSDDFDLEYAKHNGRIYRCIDYGTSNPFVCIFAWVDNDGRVVLFDELYEVGLTPTLQASLMVERMRYLGLEEKDVYNTIVDPSMKVAAHDSGQRLKSVIEIYQDNGIEHIVLGNNRRIIGWSVFRDFLRIDDPDRETGDSIPYLRVCDSCTHTIESIGTLTTSDKDIEDIDTDGDDHCADAIRYLLMFVDSPPKWEKEKDRVPKWLRELQHAGKKRNKYSLASAWAS